MQNARRNTLLISPPTNNSRVQYSTSYCLAADVQARILTIVAFDEARILKIVALDDRLCALHNCTLSPPLPPQAGTLDWDDSATGARGDGPITQELYVQAPAARPSTPISRP